MNDLIITDREIRIDTDFQLFFIMQNFFSGPLLLIHTRSDVYSTGGIAGVVRGLSALCSRYPKA